MTDQKTGISSNDYMELLMRHLVRSSPVYDKARTLKLTGDDFILDDTYGVQTYKFFVDSIMQIGFCPIDPALLSAYINRCFEDSSLQDSQFEDAEALMQFIYSGELTPGYFVDSLKDFVKSRRSAKITREFQADPDLLYQNMQSLIVDLKTDDFLGQTEDLHPFASPIFKSHQDLLGTGLTSIDEKINGLGLSEFALVIGYSGGGKTVLGCNIASNGAILGIPSQFISLEADKHEISNRFYSKFFEIPYTNLHKGMANYELEEKFKDEALQTRRETLAKNLSLIGLKGLTPISAEQIYQVMLRKYETTGFAPKIVVVDQLQFVEPNQQKKGMQSWEIEKTTAAEMDELSHKSIGGQKFALWVLHQAKGKLKGEFSRDEIDGFKGVIHKADLVLGIGRESTTAEKCNIFSLKVRHCAGFSCAITTEFEYMRFLDKVDRKATVAESSVSNPIAQAPPLPPSLTELGVNSHA